MSGLCYTKGQADVGGLPKVMYTSMGHAAAGDHIDAHCPCNPSNHVGVLGLYFCHRKLWCPWPLLQQRSGLMSIVYTATRDQAVVHGMC